MGNMETPPFTREIPMPFFGLINDPGFGVGHMDAVGVIPIGTAIGDLESIPALGEIPNTCFGGIETDGLIGDIPIGPVRSCSIIQQPPGPGHDGGIIHTPVRSFGVMSDPPCKGVMESPPAIGDSSNSPIKGWIDQV
jgi:hypothetical protein